MACCTSFRGVFMTTSISTSLSGRGLPRAYEPKRIIFCGLNFSTICCTTWSIAFCGMRFRLSIVGTFTTTILSNYTATWNQNKKETASHLSRDETPSHLRITHYLLLKFREPRYHLRRRRRAIHHAALVDSDRCAFLGIGILQICLTRQVAVHVDGAGGHPADAFATGIDHRVAVVRHADALFIKAEANDCAFAFLFARHIGIATDEPRLVRFDVRTESTFGNTQVTFAESARIQ